MCLIQPHVVAAAVVVVVAVAAAAVVVAADACSTVCMSTVVKSMHLRVLLTWLRLR